MALAAIFIALAFVAAGVAWNMGSKMMAARRLTIYYSAFAGSKANTRIHRSRFMEFAFYLAASLVMLGLFVALAIAAARI